jgi:hypothetical protein
VVPRQRWDETGSHCKGGIKPHDIKKPRNQAARHKKSRGIKPHDIKTSRGIKPTDIKPV